MKKVLLLHNANDADVLGSVPTNHEWIKQHVQNNHGLNIGNKVFVSACEQYLTKPDIEYEVYPFYHINPLEIKGKYDYVVAPLANIFNKDEKSFIRRIGEWINQAQVPVFVLGCGIQCNHDEEIYMLQREIGEDTAKFVDAVYDNGGAIATRGWLTKQYLDLCLQNEAEATGCPSFYRCGSRHVISKDQDGKDFSVAVTSTDVPKRLLLETRI